MTTSCRLHRASSDASHATSTNSLPQPAPKAMHAEEVPAAPDEELLTHEGRLRTGIHKGWTAICIGTAKCDHCNKQSRGVVQKCDFCGWSICRECSASGKLTGNKKHKLDHDAVNWDRETADTKRPSTRKNAARKKKVTARKRNAKTDIDPRAMVEEIPPYRPVSGFETDPRYAFLKPTCDAEAQTQITLAPFWIPEDPTVRGVFAGSLAVEDQDAANILAQMPSSDGLGPTEEESPVPDAALVGLPEYLHPRPNITPSHNLFPYPARVGTTYEQHISEYGTSQNKPLPSVGSRHYPSLYSQTQNFNRNTTTYHQPVAGYTPTQSRLPSPQSTRRPLLPVNHNRGAFYTGSKYPSCHYTPEPPREYNRPGYGCYEQSYYGAGTSRYEEVDTLRGRPQKEQRHEHHSAVSETTPSQIFNPPSPETTDVKLIHGYQGPSPSTSPTIKIRSTPPITLPSPFSNSKKRKIDDIDSGSSRHEQNQPWYQATFDEEVINIIHHNRIAAERNPTWSLEECFEHVQTNENPPDASSIPFEWRYRFIDRVYLRAAENLALDTTRIQFQESASHKRIRLV